VVVVVVEMVAVVVVVEVHETPHIEGHAFRAKAAFWTSAVEADAAVQSSCGRLVPHAIGSVTPLHACGLYVVVVIVVLERVVAVVVVAVVTVVMVVVVPVVVVQGTPHIMGQLSSANVLIFCTLEVQSLANTRAPQTEASSFPLHVRGK
jgi:uncharacterized membrane protein